MKRFLRWLFRRGSGVTVGPDPLDGALVTEFDLASAIEPLLDAIEDQRKKLEAIRRKVYRDEVKGDGNPQEVVPSPQDLLASLRSGDEVPPGLF